MTIETATKKAVEGKTCNLLYSLVELRNGKTMQTLWKNYNKAKQNIHKTMGTKKVLLTRMSMERKRYELVGTATKRKKDSEATQVFGLQNKKRGSLFFKRIQTAYMRQAFLSFKKTRENTLDKTKIDYTSYKAYTPLKEKHRMEKSYFQNRQLFMYFMWDKRDLFRGRPLSHNIC